MMAELALLGGKKLREKPFPAYNTIGDAEKKAVMAVLDTGQLSRFIGAHHADFLGGPKVKEFEAAFGSMIGASHVIAVNSATSALFAAVGATQAGPGDEIIVSPFTMSASAIAPIIFNAVPVFADIDPDTYCLSPASIEAKITPRTKAIIVVHIFGQAANMTEIVALASRHNLVVIEDCAQAPFATQSGIPVGLLGDIGIFSLNYHKHIHTGEGGILVTQNATLADRLQLLRNHAEAVMKAKGISGAGLINMIGQNYRLGEIEAAIGIEQIKKAPALIDQRIDNVRYLEAGLNQLSGLNMPVVPDGNRHVYYVHAIDYDERVVGVPRDQFVAAVKAELPVTELREHEGPLVSAGYVEPLYLQPMYQTLTGYGAVSCPFRCPHYEGEVDYSPGLCPNAEAAHRRLIRHELMRPPMSHGDLDVVIDAFHKVYQLRHQLLSRAA